MCTRVSITSIYLEEYQWATVNTDDAAAARHTVERARLEMGYFCEFPFQPAKKVFSFSSFLSLLASSMVATSMCLA